MNLDLIMRKLNLRFKGFKGLGEMNPEELWNTTLNPDTRNLLQVRYSKGTKLKSKEDQKFNPNPYGQ